jgi:hypothetical protein
VNAETISVLLAKGLTGDDILEVARAMEVVAPKSSAAIRQKRYRDNKRDVTRDVTPSPNERDNLTPTRVEKPSAKAEVKKFPEPEGISPEQWQAFRKQRKKPLNERSYTLVCNKLTELAEAGWPPGEMIDLAIERGWETVFAPRNFGNERADNNPTATALARVQSALRHGGAFG